MEKRVYILEGIDCASCAAKIEKRHPVGVSATRTCIFKQMKLSAKDPDALIPQIQTLINSMEDGITVVPRETGKTGDKPVSGEKKALTGIIAGAALFLTGEILEHVGAPCPR